MVSQNNSADKKIAPALLRWYDENARNLPWRMKPGKAGCGGQMPDPYHVWLSEIMLQQTTVATVGPRFLTFLERWPDIHQLAASPVEEVTGAWAGLGYYARARNLHRCARVLVADYGGVFPQTEQELKKLPGIGDYTAAAIAAIAFNQYALVMDGNIERVTARVYREGTMLPAAKPVLKEHLSRYWPRDTKSARHGDFAQALMDLGAGVCRPKAPLCLLCPINNFCQAHQSGDAQDYPVKPPRKQKPTRRGVCFIVRDQNEAIALQRRPDKGLLGGMLGFPGTQWSVEASSIVDEATINTMAPIKTTWHYTGEALHTFTHFHLIMGVYVAKVKTRPVSLKDYEWYSPQEAQLPTVMKKALETASGF